MGSQFEDVAHCGRMGMVVGAIVGCCSRSVGLLGYTWAWKQRGEWWSPITIFSSHLTKSRTPVHGMVPPTGSLPASG